VDGDTDEEASVTHGASVGIGAVRGTNMGAGADEDVGAAYGAQAWVPDQTNELVSCGVRAGAPRPRVVQQ
jgi:hypothetical protein